MDAHLLAVALVSLLAAFVRFIVGILLFASLLPHRDHFGLRAVAACVILFIVHVTLSAAFLSVEAAQTGPYFYSAQFFVFSLLLIAFVVGTIFVFDTSVWTALFCCSAGYTVQNLASGATELVWSIIGGGSVASGAYQSPERFIIGFVCAVIVYGVAFFLITRQLLRDGLQRIEDRSMLIMMAVTILVIIGFDLLIKGLTEQGLALVSVVLLRIFHGLACIFTIVMEFQLLITRRAETERDIMEQVLAEHERQYEAARESVAAVNARMHDIRHSVIRLANNEGVGRDALREMLQEIEVYDSTIKTGNEALDTVLSEKRLTLSRDGIALSCVADGTALAFMSPADIYALFSAMLDGAAAAGGNSISLVAREALGSASVHIECYGCSDKGAWNESASSIVKRYGGTFSAAEQGSTLHINALFPSR